MFVQVIQGPVADADGLAGLLDEWVEKLSPGATGWLGSTAGVTEDGQGILLARFESAQDAHANSERPEQGDWWARAEACFAEAPAFRDTEDVEVAFEGGSDTAGFVQVIQGSTSQREELQELEESMEPLLKSLHPALIGSIRCWSGNGDFTEAIYFTDEATARQGEKALGEHPDAQAGMEVFQEAMKDARYFDLKNPMLSSA
ncbi:MAG: hypothetical protein JJLCMIEE_01743 [Acidimicrobiales bacterium]|nr:MAG: hypothetical protein EDR02_05555 [Actinomycetota bacterium]MBV6508678.1 hypothetical protein [Acidimicrobiales bacterium]RIK08118.1 MAG: hypothetical protein DCC48_01675 [Acidobacteriota bacterium]